MKFKFQTFTYIQSHTLDCLYTHTHIKFINKFSPQQCLAKTSLSNSQVIVDFSQQFPSHSDFSQQFSNEHYFSQQFPSSNMIPNEPVNTPPEDIFLVFTPENEPVPNPPVVQQQPDQSANNSPARFGLTDEEILEQDFQVLREYEEAE